MSPFARISTVSATTTTATKYSKSTQKGSLQTIKVFIGALCVAAFASQAFEFHVQTLHAADIDVDDAVVDFSGLTTADSHEMLASKGKRHKKKGTTRRKKRQVSVFVLLFSGARTCLIIQFKHSSDSFFSCFFQCVSIWEISDFSD